MPAEPRVTQVQLLCCSRWEGCQHHSPWLSPLQAPLKQHILPIPMLRAGWFVVPWERAAYSPPAAGVSHCPLQSMCKMGRIMPMKWSKGTSESLGALGAGSHRDGRASPPTSTHGFQSCGHTEEGRVCPASKLMQDFPEFRVSPTSVSSHWLLQWGRG